MAVLLFAAAIAWQTLVPPIVGLADNFDYGIVTGWYRFSPVDPPYPDHAYKYLPLKFRENPGPRQLYLITSEILLTAPPYLLGRLFSKDGLYDLRWSGCMHAAVYLCAVWLALAVVRTWTRWRRWLAFGVLFFVFTDVVYISYLNSLYTDTASLLALLLTAGSWVCLISEGRRSIAIVFLLSCILLVTSKAQHAILGVPLVLFLGWKRAFLLSVAGRRTAIALIGLVAAGTAAALLTVRGQYKAMAYYDIVFSRIVPAAAASPKEAVRQLGLPESYVAYSGSHSYVPGGPMEDATFREDLGRRLSYARLALYYVRHPGLATRFIRIGLGEAAPQREDYLGNFPKSAGLKPGAQSSSFAVWSGIKKSVFSTRPILLAITLGTFLLFSGVVLWHCRLEQPIATHGLHSLVLLASWMALELGIACLTDCMQTGRHLFLFMTMGDIALAAMALLAIGRIGRLRRFAPREAGEAAVLSSKR